MSLKEDFIRTLKETGRFDHHECGLCGVSTAFLSDGKNLWYTSSCGCSWSEAKILEWSALDEYVDPKYGWIPKIEQYIKDNPPPKKRIDVAKQVRELRAIAMDDIENVEPESPEYQLFAETIALCDRYLNSLPSEPGS